MVSFFCFLTVCSLGGKLSVVNGNYIVSIKLYQDNCILYSIKFEVVINCCHVVLQLAVS